MKITCNVKFKLFKNDEWHTNTVSFLGPKVSESIDQIQNLSFFVDKNLEYVEDVVVLHNVGIYDRILPRNIISFEMITHEDNKEK